jgi:hypothetical protein
MLDNMSRCWEAAKDADPQRYSSTMNLMNEQNYVFDRALAVMRTSTPRTARFAIHNTHQQIL